MKKLFALLLACLMIAGMFAGCAPQDKGSVYWLNFKPESDETCLLYTSDAADEGLGLGRGGGRVI